MSTVRGVRARTSPSTLDVGEAPKRTFNQALRVTSATAFELGNALEVIGLVGDPDCWMIRQSPGYKGQGEDFNIGWEHPEFPSVNRPYGPAE